MAEPAYSFSLPSIHDDTPLDCRVYHPKSLHALLDQNRKVFGAVFAHPYAPLGGSYDDPVVLSVVETLLEEGFIVGTFNFRGAGESHGKTTWTGKAEQDDYVSVGGFMIYYLQDIVPEPDSNVLEPIISVDPQASQAAGAAPAVSSSKAPLLELVLGGYSYGSLIVARLPPVSNIIQRFQQAEIGTAAAEIILRARTLGKETRKQIGEAQHPSSPRGRNQLRPSDANTSPTKRIGASPMTMGGEETDLSERRRSRDARQSGDFVRKSVEMSKRFKTHRRRSSTPESSPIEQQATTPTSPQMREQNQSLPDVRVCYLLISPVILPFTQTLCPPGPPSTVLNVRRRSTDGSASGQLILQYPTLAVFGSTDTFTSSKRLRAWAEKQSHDSRSRFEWTDVEGAGHFWRENGSMKQLQDRIAGWVKAGQ